MSNFSLKFGADQIRYWAARYETNVTEDLIEHTIAPRVRLDGYFTKPDFLTVCEWKSPRPRARYARNSEDRI